MIAEDIHNGKTATELNLPDGEYESRVETLDLFLAQWDGSDFKEAYIIWLDSRMEEETTKIVSPAGNRDEVESEDETDLTFGETFKGLALSIKGIIKSGIKISSNEEHSHRYEICLACKYLEGGACVKCGCFMKLKTKFKAMKCPIGLW